MLLLESIAVPSAETALPTEEITPTLVIRGSTDSPKKTTRHWARDQYKELDSDRGD